MWRSALCDCDIYAAIALTQARRRRLYRLIGNVKSVTGTAWMKQMRQKCEVSSRDRSVSEDDEVGNSLTSGNWRARPCRISRGAIPSSLLWMARRFQTKTSAISRTTCCWRPSSHLIDMEIGLGVKSRQLFSQGEIEDHWVRRNRISSKKHVTFNCLTLSVRWRVTVQLRAYHRPMFASAGKELPK